MIELFGRLGVDIGSALQHSINVDIVPVAKFASRLAACQTDLTHRSCRVRVGFCLLHPVRHVDRLMPYHFKLVVREVKQPNPATCRIGNYLVACRHYCQLRDHPTVMRQLSQLRPFQHLQKAKKTFAGIVGQTLSRSTSH